MFGLPPDFYLRVALWAVGLHGVWEYAQVIPLYRCWERWTRRQRVWVLPAATLGDAVATVVFAGLTAAILGPDYVRPFSGAGAALLLGLGLEAGLVFETVARRLDLWRYRDIMPTIRIAGHHVGIAPVLQMTLLPALAVGLVA
ncbi:MAG: hypothetical protein ABEK84_07560 [Salinibacter sp.]